MHLLNFQINRRRKKPNGKTQFQHLRSFWSCTPHLLWHFHFFFYQLVVECFVNKKKLCGLDGFSPSFVDKFKLRHHVYQFCSKFLFIPLTTQTINNSNESECPMKNSKRRYINPEENFMY